MDRLSKYQYCIFQRNLKVILSLQQLKDKQQVAQEFQLSLRTIYNIQAQMQNGGIRALIPKSRAPKIKPAQDPLLTQAIGLIREQTHWGADKIHEYLQTHRSAYRLENSRIPSARTIHHILITHDYIKRPSTRNTPQSGKPDYYHLRDIQKPGRILEADMKTDHYLEKQPVIVNGIIDIGSKITTAHVGQSQGTLDAALNLIEHVYRWGLPEILKTDNDMAYIGQIEGSTFGIFTRLCLKLGIEQVFVPVRKPRWKPFIERFFRTWDEDFFEAQHHTGWDTFPQANCEYIHQYNTQRPHQGLKESPCNFQKINIPQLFHQQYAEIKLPDFDKQTLIQQIKQSTIPLNKGRVSFIRKLPQNGVIDFKQNRFTLPDSYQGKMIKATIYVVPKQNPLQVDFYFKDHKIMTSGYRFKKFKNKML